MANVLKRILSSIFNTKNKLSGKEISQDRNIPPSTILSLSVEEELPLENKDANVPIQESTLLQNQKSKEIPNESIASSKKEDSLSESTMMLSYNEPFDLFVAYQKCMEEKGRIDIEYLNVLTGLSKNDIQLVLKESFYLDPIAYEQGKEKYISKEEYLSGNLAQKLKDAKKANSIFEGMFSKNIEDLNFHMPIKKEFSSFYVTLGNPMIPPYMIDQFISYLFLDETTLISKTSYNAFLNKWFVDSNYLLEDTIFAKKTYGTDRFNLFQIIRKTLNHETIVVIDHQKDYVSNKLIKEVNKKETMFALEKQSLLLQKFDDFLNNHMHLKKELEDIYHDRYGCFKARNFTGQYLSFQGMNPNISLYEYQKKAVSRILFTPSTLLAHDVGTGKTYVLIAAGMELKMKHPESKIMYVVPNSILSQWKEDFIKLYPHSHIKTIYPSTFTPKNRQAILKELKEQDFDAILIAYSSFELIPLRKSFYIYQIQEEMKQVLMELSKEEFTHVYSTVKIKEQKELNNYYTSLKKKLEIASKEEEDSSLLYFDDLQITSLFVDEAHNFKNVPIKSNLNRLRGINTTGSNKCLQMALKVQFTQNKENSHIVFATGTPIVNSITDLYVMQLYLNREVMKQLDLSSFDNWVGMFSKLSTEFEMDVDVNQYKEVTRFSTFNNLKLLSILVNQFTDFYASQEDKLPHISGYNIEKMDKSNVQQEWIEKISYRVDNIRANRISRKEDNLLKVTTDGKKLALDPRLLDTTLDACEGIKVKRCADIVHTLYLKNPSKAQIVFSDMGTPKESFNVYDALKLELMKKGMQPYEIQFVHDATSDLKREQLFHDVKNGIVKVLIGSTFKLGIGVNVQDHLIALHHLDVPWRPSDMIQREGRILRQGNLNEEVYIYRYITSGTFDAYLWQILETKQSFISQLLSGCLNVDTASNVDESVLSYAEVKALAIGNPLIKERFEIANHINKLKLLQRQDELKQESLTQFILNVPLRILSLKESIENTKKDKNQYAMQEDLSNTLKKEIGENWLAQYMKTTTLSEEYKLGTYKEFSILMSPQATLSNPFVLLKGANTYPIYFKESGWGIFIRIDNLFKNMDQQIQKLEEKLSRLIKEEAQAHIELKTLRTEQYVEEIENEQKKLDEIDRKLNENEKNQS